MKTLDTLHSLKNTVKFWLEEKAQTEVNPLWIVIILMLTVFLMWTYYFKPFNKEVGEGYNRMGNIGFIEGRVYQLNLDRQEFQAYQGQLNQFLEEQYGSQTNYTTTTSTNESISKGLAE